MQTELIILVLLEWDFFLVHHTNFCFHSMFMVLLEEEVTGVTALRDSSLMYSCRVLLQEDEEASGRTVIVKFNVSFSCELCMTREKFL